MFCFTKFASFVRQLNMYGFNKLNNTSNLSPGSNISTTVVDGGGWEFKHPDFRRGEVNNLQNIKRKASKANVQYPKHQQQQQQHSSSSAGGHAYEEHIQVTSHMNKDERIDYLTHKVSELEEKL
jgi:hypothetical protein